MWMNHMGSYRVFGFLMVFGTLARKSCCQTVEPMNIESSADSCNVVNVRFGDGSSHRVQETALRVGAPGKRGPVGPTGPIGAKGVKGDPGPKGAAGKDINETKMKVDIVGMLSTSSCEELNQKYGVSQSGYYMLMRNSLLWKSPMYHYCDFKIYEDATNCGDLVATYNVTIHGSYRIREKSGQLTYRFCPEPLTCHHLVLRDGIKESGLYQLGHEGATFEVYCNLFSGEAVTEVWHDSMNEEKIASSCESNGCYSRIPQYKVTLKNILKMIENSRECRQYIKLRCHGVVLAYISDPFGWWVSRDGEKMLYWGGAASRRPYFCACGETGSCVNKAHKCNCDNNGNMMTQDEGYLTDKSKLPVREMKFGDLEGTDEQAWHTLGMLECVGQAEK